jgi:hypothetical protein
MQHNTTEAIKRLAEEHFRLKGLIEKHEEQLTENHQRIRELLERQEVETVTVGEEDDTIKVTVVRPTRLEFNEAGLEKALSEALWRQVTKRVLDKKALEDAVSRGKIDISVVSENSKEVATKPYLKITR